MKFSPISLEEITFFVSEYYKCKKNGIGIILTNGNNLWGRLQSQSIIYSSSNEEKRDCFTGKLGCIELYYSAPFKEISVFIPLVDIAGLYNIEIKQEYISSKTERWAENYSNGSIEEELFRSFLARKATENNYVVFSHHILYSLSLKKFHFDWGKASFCENTPLYADWEYFRLHSNGINSIGFGFALGSFSVGWEKNLMSKFYKKLNHEEINITDKVLKGYIFFLESETNILSMEGSDWYAAVLCKEKIKNLSSLKNKKWELVYFKANCFMIPCDLWNKFDQEVTVFSEVINIPTKTKVGNCKCFLKARGAAYMKSK